jgi:ATP-dependent Zn protease
LNFEHAEAGHALVGALMPEYDPVAKISIIPRGQAGGLTFFAPSEERLESGLYSRSYLENQMAVALGGRWGFHENSVCFCIHQVLILCRVMNLLSCYGLQGC